MQAMNGSAGSVRSRGRLIGCCMALALTMSAMVLAPSAGAVTHPTKTYLALGDSLAFGYTQVKHTENQPGDSPAFFEEGYTHFYAKKVRATKEFEAVPVDNKGMVEVNDGCPGETTDSFFGEGVEKGFGTNCEYQAQFTAGDPQFRGGPLHNPYPGESQQSNMLQILNGGAPKHPISVITLNIGANDELAGVKACQKQIQGEYEANFNPGPPPTSSASQPKGGSETTFPLTPKGIEGATTSCVVFTAFTKVFPHVQARVEQTLEEIYGPGGYTGKTGVLGNYNPFTFIIGGSDALQKILNEKLEAAVNATGKNYTGKVVLANPLLKFNGPEEKTKAEQAKICKYTEMCNATAQAENTATAEARFTTEQGEGKFLAGVVYPHNPAEGDIHPTKVGYETLGKILYEALPL